jgi:hypothetical protein
VSPRRGRPKGLAALRRPKVRAHRGWAKTRAGVGQVTLTPPWRRVRPRAGLPRRKVRARGRAKARAGVGQVKLTRPGGRAKARAGSRRPKRRARRGGGATGAAGAGLAAPARVSAVPPDRCRAGPTPRVAIPGLLGRRLPRWPITWLPGRGLPGVRVLGLPERPLSQRPTPGLRRRPLPRVPVRSVPLRRLIRRARTPRPPLAWLRLPAPGAGRGPVTPSPGLGRGRARTAFPQTLRDCLAQAATFRSARATALLPSAWPGHSSRRPAAPGPCAPRNHSIMVDQRRPRHLVTKADARAAATAGRALPSVYPDVSIPGPSPGDDNGEASRSLGTAIT